ncbi:MAG: DNA mismatch repair endonuclease MutL [Longimicrobiales bacterium]
MARRIHILPDTLVSQIAAGEVVERPASVVKELVENALDAGATRVEIGVQNGGKTEIRVADDGHGMGREDALLALDRHATSKIGEVDDLRAVRTFGFRGEALPSIGSVTRLTLETAESGEVGTRVRVSGGRVLGVEECARQGGTTITVRSLFFNVPARAKFLKSAAAETRAVADVVTTLALANLSVSFRLESNGRELLELPTASDLSTRAAALWGDEVAAHFLGLIRRADGITVAGLIDRPDAAASGPRRTYLFVGGRPFRDRELIAAAERGYRTTVPRSARPSLLLYLEVPPGTVDVNVHPSKAEVKFSERGRVEDAIELAVRDALGGIESAAPLGRAALPRLAPLTQHDTARRPATRPDGERPQFTLFVRATQPHEQEQEAAAAPAGAPTPAAASTSPVAVQAGGPRLWQIHDTYILAETRGGLIIVDQHSAHERVLFDELMAGFSSGGVPSQRLLFPITLRLAPAEFAVVEDNRSLFARAGFELEPFGGRTILVQSVPNPHPYFDAERCLREMLGELAAGSELTRSAKNQHERIAATFACKAAVKAGQSLSHRELVQLFDRLFETALPYHDVHGRPTVIRLSLQELERRFGRHG